MYVRVCIISLFHSGCEKSSDQMTKIILRSQKINDTQQLLSELRGKCSLKSQPHLFLESSKNRGKKKKKVPPVHFRTVLRIMTDV